MTIQSSIMSMAVFLALLPMPSQAFTLSVPIGGKQNHQSLRSSPSSYTFSSFPGSNLNASFSNIRTLSPPVFTSAKAKATVQLPVPIWSRGSNSKLYAHYDMNDDVGKNDSNSSSNSIIEPTIIDKVLSTDYLNKGAKADTTIPIKRNMNHGVHPAIINAWKSIRNTFANRQLRQKSMTIFAAAIIMISVLFGGIIEDASAAGSGGRMGGSYGGSSRSRSPSSSRSYSSPSRSYSSPSSSYNRGYSRGYYSRPSVTVAPIIGSPGYGSYGYGVPTGVVVARGPSVVDFIFFLFFAGVAVNVISGIVNGGNDFSRSLDEASPLGKGVSVVQVSVALNVPRRDSPSSILTYLDQLSRTASTDSRVGISNLVSQVALELIRQKPYIFAANTEYKHFRDNDEKKATRYFNNVAVEERGKFEREGTNKYGGVDYSTTGNKLSDQQKLSAQATSAVITILIEIDGDETKLPQINNINDLQRALTTLATDVKVEDCLRSAEILWTPEGPDDVLSDKDVIIDYPKLRSV
uniref:Uncharacterized protein n=1 Tax=Chaetoceros debilis TaxID=122233 RepID=A0A7S3Q2C8_9STRA